MPNKEFKFSDNVNSKVLDEIGNWSLVKHDIIKRYATEYSRILAKDGKFYHVYVDAFCGPGVAKSKETGEFVLGSAAHALTVTPPFKRYYFIDLNRDKTTFLERHIVGQRDDVEIITEDCNEALVKHVFPHVKYDEYRRGLCLLDPYGLHLNWNVLETAGTMRSVEIFLNFPIMDINRSVIRSNPAEIDDKDLKRMNTFWGSSSWYDFIYTDDFDLFESGKEARKEKANSVLPKQFADRLKAVAGFKFVPEPIPIRNNSKAILYYLFFASHNRVGEKIVKYIFDKYRDWGLN